MAVNLRFAQVNLRFDEPRVRSRQIDLRFGSGPSVPADPGVANLNMVGTIPAPVMLGYMAQPRVIHIAATLPAPIVHGQVMHVCFGDFAARLDLTMSAHVNYDNAVWRGPGISADAPWQNCSAINGESQDRFVSPDAVMLDVDSDWHDGSTGQNMMPINWQSASPNHGMATDYWSDATQNSAGAQSSFGELNSNNLHSDSGWADANQAPASATLHWRDLMRSARPVTDATWQLSKPAQSMISGDFGVAVRLPKSSIVRWQVAMQPSQAGAQPPINPPIPHDYIPPSGGQVGLQFDLAPDGNANLIFGIGKSVLPPGAVVIPVKRTYIVVNNVMVSRVEGNYELPTMSLSLSIDSSSWTWSFNAKIPTKALPMVEPVRGNPVLLKASINGNDYLLLVEQIQRDRTFGAGAVQISGRGQSAVLDAPYSPELVFRNGELRSAQQLMADALTINGVSIGWDIDWRIADWPVPAGAWHHQGTYMSAAKAIASAAGAFIQPDPVRKVLRVRPRYPSAPWAANQAPDLILPVDVITKEAIAWEDKPAYSVAYVSGTTADGVLGRVKRTGSAGDLAAPLTTDALITHPDAARQRGLSILADTGRIATYSLSLPILRETGVIEPGTSVRYVDGTTIVQGLVRSVSISAQLPTVRQTIALEVNNG